MQKIGVPQPEQVIKASSMGIIEQLKEVNEKVLPLFSEAAEQLMSLHGGDVKRALCQTLALLSGHHKEEMMARSLLTGQEDCVTFQLTMDKPFYAVSLVWNVLRRYLPDKITSNIKGMRCFKDSTGAVFDVSASDAERLEDIFEHETNGRRVDFQVSRCTALPELKEDDRPLGGLGQQRSYEGRFQGGQSYGNNRGNSSYGSNQQGGYPLRTSYS